MCHCTKRFSGPARRGGIFQRHIRLKPLQVLQRYRIFRASPRHLREKEFASVSNFGADLVGVIMDNCASDVVTLECAALQREADRPIDIFESSQPFVYWADPFKNVRREYHRGARCEPASAHVAF